MLFYCSLTYIQNDFQLNICGNLGIHGPELLLSPLVFESRLFQRQNQTIPYFQFILPGMGSIVISFTLDRWPEDDT